MESSSSKNIKVGSIITYINQFLSIAISLFYVPIMLGKLGQSEYGLYALVQSIITYLQMTEMGIGTTATRYNSKYIADKDEDGQKTINGMFLVLYLIIAVGCLIVGTIVYFCLPSIYSSYSAENILLIEKLFIIAMINLLITFIFKIFNSVILAYEKFIFIKLLSLIQTILGPIGMLTVLFMGAGSVGMLCVTTALSLIFGLIQMFFCFSKLKMKFDFRHFKKELFIAIFSFTSFVFLNSIAHQLFSNTDKIIVSIIMDEMAVAIYAIVLQFDTYFYNFTNVISGFYLPRFTKMVTSDQKNDEEIMNQLVQTGRIQVIIAGLILGGFLAIGHEFINKWVGPEYSIAYVLTAIQFITDYVGASQSMFNSLMQALNFHKGRSLIGLLAALLKVAMTIIFVKFFGLYGCVIAYLIVYLIRFILFNIYYQKRAKINVSIFWKNMLKIYLPITVILLSMFALFKIVCAFLVIDNYLLILSFALIYVFVYCGICYLLVFNSYERGLIKNIFKRIFKRNDNNKLA